MIMIKIFGRFFKFVLPWEAILGFIIELAAKLLNDWMSEKTFTKKMKYFTMMIYVLCEGLGEELVLDTKTTVDDKLVAEVIGLCQAAAKKNLFKLPEVVEVP